MLPLRPIAVLLCLFWLAPTAGAQVLPSEGSSQNSLKERLLFERLSVKEGLSQVTVEAVLQDRQGFMWFATQDGLSRYDGYGFTVYRPEPGNPKSLSANLVTALHEDAEGTLWVGTEKGLNRLNRRTGTFTHYRHDPDDPQSLSGDFITALADGPDGALWVGTRGTGLNRLDDPAEKTFTRFQHDPQEPKSLASNAVRALRTGTNGTLWVGTADGLDRLQTEAGTFVHVLPGRLITALHEDSSGALWLGSYDRRTERGGLSRFEPEVGVTDSYPHDPAVPQGLGGRRVMAISTGHAPGVLRDERGDMLWVGTYGGGLHLFDPKTGTFARYQHRPDDPSSLGSNVVTDVLEGRFGVLWVGTDRSGISRSDRQSGTFAHYQHVPGDPNSLSDDLVYSIREDRNGILWIGTLGSGLNRLDRQSGTVTRYRYEPDQPGGLSGNRVSAVHEDRMERLWIGTSGGLDRLERQTGRFTNYPLAASDSVSGPSGVSEIYEAADSTLWIGTYREGVIHFDPNEGTVVKAYSHSGDPGGLSGNRINEISAAQDGKLWVGTTQGGLNLLDPETGRVKQFRHDPDDPRSLSSDFVVAVLRDRKGRFWVATYGGGLNRLDPEDGFTRYTEQNSGLPSNTLAGLVEGEDGHLWISTYSGLAQFDPERETFRTYGPDRGIQSTEFNVTAYHKGRSGELFFGGVNGMNAFYPEQVDVNPYPPEVALTDALIRTHSTGRDSSLDGHSPARLAHHQNDFSFEYVGLHYAAPHRNTYAYRLDGYDAGWQAVGARRQAVYTNLDPGEYTFRVKAANRDGVWSEGKMLLAFTIRPPWWDTWWAYGAYALVLALGVFAVDRFQRSRLVERERGRAALREAKLRTEIAEKENARKTRELEEARQLQLSMLPKTTPTLPQAQVAAHMQTATEVGGDYYDFRRTEDGALLLAIGDATGHGARAGTMVTVTKTLFNSLPDGQGDLERGENGLAHLLQRATGVLRRLGMRRLYMALALGRLSGNRLELAGAGLPPALIYRAAQGTVEEVPLKGMPLGGLAGFPYRQHALALAPGDVVVLMSDGFPEAFDAERRMLGYDRAATVLRESADASAQDIIARFEETARRWIGERPLSDDMTFVVLKMSG